MSEDSKQLSVAELLARNGQQGASSGGGGRRRRSGRGISVAELTGDLPAIPVGGGGGHSAHAAPEEDEAPAYEPPAYESTGFDPSGYQPSGYQSAGFDTPAPEPPSYTPPAPPPTAYAAPEMPNYSPMSGPITRYDPLSAYAAPEAPADPLPAPGRSNRVMPGREMPPSRHSAPADPLSAPLSDLYAPAPDPYARDPLASDGVGSGRTGRRRRHAEPEEETTEVRPLRDIGRRADAPAPSNGQQNGSRTGGRAARRRAEEAAQADVGPSTAPWSPSTNGFAPESAPLPIPDSPSRSKAGPGRGAAPEPPEQRRRDGAHGPADGGLPAWSARRHAPSTPADNETGIPPSAWALASQDQQLVSGQTVAGDLLRDGVERAERAVAERANGNGRGRRGRAERDGGPAPVDVYDGRTDVYEPFSTGDALDEHDDDADFDGDYDEESDAHHSGAAASSPRRSRIARKAEYDANRRQWMILGGQSTGAAIAGMLLFKGFERMWEMLPWVALCLAMIVILGLVALVRILRRTDDILSTVIAVVVGIFVTLGPLAFLLSTN
ncbi:hypothetical protein OG874_31230 [Nocardia sp. NBC_00565]|uniref:hypothetical protein n=1 Tax=Nocardia sp. NBC_00565 TaxID=2975993 RepID=UPI002E809BCB|nr:hypothetical protein [Nocardia sp. NBC_00565]WUC01251.1 hypothetical protein OG874_31230 [Nocardia sp. NBC_00565]